MGKSIEKNRKILFEVPLIKAFLDNRKSQSRKIITPQPERVQRHLFDSDYSRFTDGVNEYKCPYGSPGDRVWVPEAWQIGKTEEGPALIYGTDYTVCPIDPESINVKVSNWLSYIKTHNGPWRSPVRMPRSCARLWMRLTDVRVVRIQQISDEDAIAGGVWRESTAGKKPWACWYAQPEISEEHGMILPRPGFAKLWNSLHGEPKPAKRNPYTNKKEACYVSYPWQESQRTEEYDGLPHYIVGNPYVWILEFEKIELEILKSSKSDLKSAFLS